SNGIFSAGFDRIFLRIFFRRLRWAGKPVEEHGRIAPQEAVRALWKVFEPESGNAAEGREGVSRLLRGGRQIELGVGQSFEPRLGPHFPARQQALRDHLRSSERSSRPGGNAGGDV